jgi:hypothetical protein
MYKDAYNLAVNSGQGYSKFSLDSFEDMQKAVISEDVPDTANLERTIHIPETSFVM